MRDKSDFLRVRRFVFLLATSTRFFETLRIEADFLALAAHDLLVAFLLRVLVAFFLRTAIFSPLLI